LAAQAHGLLPEQQSTGLLNSLGATGVGSLSRPAGFQRRLLVKPVAAVAAEEDDEDGGFDEEEEDEDDLGKDDLLGVSQQVAGIIAGPCWLPHGYCRIQLVNNCSFAYYDYLMTSSCSRPHVILFNEHGFSTKRNKDSFDGVECDELNFSMQMMRRTRNCHR